jgi:acylphosphatase
MQRISIRITGKVQGVSFRKYTQSKALELGLTGFVENQSNNAVYLEAQGNPESLQILLQWTYKGSPLSVVNKVEPLELPPISNESGFEIRKNKP